MDITTKDQRMYRYKFVTMQHLQNCYMAIMMSTQITRHQNLFAYKYMDAIVSQNKNGNAQALCFRDVKTIVSKEYERLEVF